MYCLSTIFLFNLNNIKSNLFISYNISKYLCIYVHIYTEVLTYFSMSEILFLSFQQNNQNKFH